MCAGSEDEVVLHPFPRRLRRRLWHPKHVVPLRISIDYSPQSSRAYSGRDRGCARGLRRTTSRESAFVSSFSSRDDHLGSAKTPPEMTQQRRPAVRPQIGVSRPGAAPPVWALRRSLGPRITLERCGHRLGRRFSASRYGPPSSSAESSEWRCCPLKLTREACSCWSL